MKKFWLAVIGLVIAYCVCLNIFGQVVNTVRPSPNVQSVTSLLSSNAIYLALGYVPANGNNASLPASASGFLTNNGSGTLGYYSPVAKLPADNAFSGNNTFSGSNFLSGPFTFTTNSCTGAPDFAKPSSFYSTNAAFTFAAPINVDPSKKTDTWISIYVTNTTAAAVAITAPANCHPNGVAYVTNLSIVWFQIYGGLFTNMIVNPIF